MPVTTAVSALTESGVATVGDYLRTVRSGDREPADLVVIGVGTGGVVTADRILDESLRHSAAEVVAAAQLTGKAGQSAVAVARVGDSPIRVLFLGVADRSPAALRRAGGELGRLARPGEEILTDIVADLPAGLVQAFAEGILLGSYRFREKSPDPSAQVKSSVARILVRSADPEAIEAVSRAAIIGAAVGLARDLANTPSARKSPQWLADAAAGMAADAGLGVRIWDQAELLQAGFGGILAVGSGSARPPRLIELSYAPEGARRHVVLVGKGITFDSGGLSLKSNDGMKLMKTDMAGGAAVIAAMSALPKLGAGDRVTGLIAAAENMPSGSAFRPGDVLTQFGGRTVEVRNTDAEGRLVLADAMAYADAELAPDQLVDLATLTGAARIALGSSRAALYASSDELADALLAAGEASGDRLWRMPLPDDYHGMLDSTVADLANLPGDGDGAGSIAAALFLREFSGGRPWAHLDIAGPARSTADDGEVTAGATGFGTRLLISWLLTGSGAREVSS
jgi:leucyl aminopeptidase